VGGYAIEKLGVRNTTDLLTKLPQEMGSTINQNIANGGDGSVIPNLRGLLPKETLVLVDGKRVAPNVKRNAETNLSAHRQIFLKSLDSFSLWFSMDQF
jgi:outer membrane receptor for ferrienterochelin and colicin